MPDQYDYELLKHHHALEVAAKLIEIAKDNMPQLTSVLNVYLGRRASAQAEAQKQKMVEELLILLAEEFDLSPDLVRAGEGYRRRYKSKKRRLEFVDTLPTKRTPIPGEGREDGARRDSGTTAPAATTGMAAENEAERQKDKERKEAKEIIKMTENKEAGNKDKDTTLRENSLDKPIVL